MRAESDEMMRMTAGGCWCWRWCNVRAGLSARCLLLRVYVEVPMGGENVSSFACSCNEDGGRQVAACCVNEAVSFCVRFALLTSSRLTDATGAATAHGSRFDKYRRAGLHVIKPSPCLQPRKLPCYSSQRHEKSRNRHLYTSLFTINGSINKQ